jgi:NAD(P)-dependent dehydrogenase (short-subunit alcohol dehydrogenase family)
MARALIIGSSGGIGRAVTAAISERGDDVVGLSRGADGIDVTDEAAIARVLGAQKGLFDLIFVATGALVVDGHQPEKTIKALSPEALIGQFKTNALGPALVLKHSLALMPRDQPCVFAVLSARVGSIGDNRIGGWHSYRTAKAALNQLIHGAAIELARSHKHAICVCLHPGTVETRFTEAYVKSYTTVPPACAAGNLLSVIDGLSPAQSGGFFDYAGNEIPW